MTLIDLSAALTDLGGPVPSRSGTIHVTYVVAGGLGYVEVDGARVTLPARVVIPYVDGVPTVPVDLVPTRGVCAARWDIYPDEPVTRRLAGFHTEIPDVPVVDFGDLITVDPETYLPNGETVAAWQAAILEVMGLRDDTVAAITDSGWDADLAEEAKAAAPVAVQASVDAVDAKDAAESARDAAVAAKNAAEAVPAQVDEAMQGVLADPDSGFGTDLKATIDAVLGSGVDAVEFNTYNGYSTGTPGTLRPGEGLELSAQYGNAGHRLDLHGAPGAGVMPYLQVTADPTITTDGGNAVGGLQLHFGDETGSDTHREYWMVELIGPAHPEGKHVRIAQAASGNGVIRPQRWYNASLALALEQKHQSGPLAGNNKAHIRTIQDIRMEGNSNVPLHLRRSDGSGSGRIRLDGSGASGNDGGLIFTKVSGTPEAPSRPVVNARMGILEFAGARADGTENYDVGANIAAWAHETWSPTARGTKLEFSIAARGTTALAVHLGIQDTAAGETAILVQVNRAGTKTVSRVTIGDADSAGTGYRQLRVVN